MIKNIIIAVALLSGICAILISLRQPSIDVVYVDMGKLYDGFVLSKELDADLEKALKTRKKITDSLYESLRNSTQEVKFKEKKTTEDIQRLAKMEEEYMYKQQQFEKENQAASADYMSKIWNQLNEYLQDYGTENKYTFILGANGQGNIMFGDKGRNITDQAILYVNARYNDKIK